MTLQEYFKTKNLFRNNSDINLSEFKVEKDGTEFLWLTPLLPKLDKYAMMNKYYMTILDNFVENDIITEKVAETLNRNTYKYNRLFNISLLDYNPTWNVDGTEKRTTVHGAQSGTTTSGERIDHVDMGAQNSTTSNLHKVAGYDANILNSESSDDSSMKTGARSDISTTGSQTNGFNNNEFTDIETFVRGGNIGTVDTTTLLSKELDWLSRYSVVESIVNDVVSELCIGVY